MHTEIEHFITALKGLMIPFISFYPDGWVKIAQYFSALSDVQGKSCKLLIDPQKVAHFGFLHRGIQGQTQPMREDEDKSPLMESQLMGPCGWELSTLRGEERKRENPVAINTPFGSIGNIRFGNGGGRKDLVAEEGI